MSQSGGVCRKKFIESTAGGVSDKVIGLGAGSEGTLFSVSVSCLRTLNASVGKTRFLGQEIFCARKFHGIYKKHGSSRIVCLKSH